MSPLKTLLVLTLFLGISLGQRTANEDNFDVGEEKDEDVVEILAPVGAIHGKRVPNGDGSSYHFLGIPYAAPPVGPLRFAPTKPVEPWGLDSPLNASEFGSVCTQSPFVPGESGLNGEEDCLFLNVFVPRLPAKGRSITPTTSSLLPVMFFIHGGGFNIGGGNYVPTQLMDKDVIVVTINYRLGPFGFLALNNPEVPGNMGLLDQLEALRFVQRNIRAFGGDPTRVTLFGNSAGAASAHLLQISPLGSGLFRAAILQGGTALYPAKAITDQKTEADSAKFVTRMGCSNSTDMNQIVSCLRGANASALASAAGYTTDIFSDLENDLAHNNGSLTFSVVVDGHFMPKHPIKIMQEGAQKDIPIVLGVNADEGSMFVAMAWNNMDKLSKNWTYFGPEMVLFKNPNEITEDDEIKMNVTKRFYVGEEDFSRDNKEKTAEMFSDLYFFHPATVSADMMSSTQSQPVFVYKITHGPSKSISQVFGVDEDLGVNHGDELAYLFEDPFFSGEESVITEEDVETEKVVTDLWSNFAHHADPTPYESDSMPVWAPYGETNGYMNINPEPSMMDHESLSSPEREYFLDKVLWNDIIKDVNDNDKPVVYGAPAPAIGGAPGLPFTYSYSIPAQPNQPEQPVQVAPPRRVTYQIRPFGNNFASGSFGNTIFQ